MAYSMLDKHAVLSALKKSGVIAVIRTDNPDDLIGVAKALSAGGLRFIEITMTIPGAMKIIEETISRLKNKEIYIGAGTVLDAETARLAILAGASFIVGPTFNLQMVELCNRYGVTVIPGGFTPQEILDAWQGGADIVKVFPANLAGPKFIKDIKGPLPQIELLPTGGIDLQTAPEFIKAGAFAVGIGNELAGKRFIAEHNFKKITENARIFMKSVQKAKSETRGK